METFFANWDIIYTAIGAVGGALATVFAKRK